MRGQPESEEDAWPTVPDGPEPDGPEPEETAAGARTTARREDAEPAAELEPTAREGSSDVPPDDDAREAIGPWTRLSRRVAYENPWIRVLHDDVIRPDGEPGIYGVVHFRNRAVGVVALDPDGRILLVGQHRYTLGRYSWEIPEGGVAEDEDPLAGARRELEEETGYRASSWRPLVRLDLSNSVTDESGALYVAEGLEPGVPRPDGTERIDVRWVTLDEAVALIDDGAITDSMSQIGILRHALDVATERRREVG